MLRAIMKSVVIPLPEIVRLTFASEASASVSSRPTTTLWSVPADSATAPPVALPGMSPERSDASTSPPDGGSWPLAALMTTPAAGTVACTPVD